MLPLFRRTEGCPTGADDLRGAGGEWRALEHAQCLSASDENPVHAAGHTGTKMA